MRLDGKPRDHRMLAIGLCAGAIVLFLYAAFSYRWLENPSYGVGFSLIAFESCRRECTTMSNFELIETVEKARSRREEPPSTVFAPAGVITMALSLLSVIALGAAAWFAWRSPMRLASRRRRLTWPVLPTTIALLSTMGALLFGCLFVGKKPGGYGAVGVGISFWAFAAACVIGIVGAQLLHKMLKPLDPLVGDPA